MFIYQLRSFDGKNWNIIASYADPVDATNSALRLDTEWDINKVTVKEADK